MEFILLRFARGEDDVDDVLLDFLVHIDVGDHPTGLDDVFRLDDFRRFGTAALQQVHADDIALLLLLGIGYPRLEHETVHLRLGQRIGALLFERVLGGQHEERLRQRPGLVADSHLPLLHGLEQGTLYLGGRTVNLVGKHEIGENGTALDIKLLPLLGVYQRPDDVGRQQVGRELNAAETRVHRFGERRYGKRLGKSRYPLQQDVPVGKEAYQQGVDEVPLSHDDFPYLPAQRIHEQAFALDALVQFIDVYYFVHFRANILPYIPRRTAAAGLSRSLLAE